MDSQRVACRRVLASGQNRLAKICRSLARCGCRIEMDLYSCGSCCQDQVQGVDCCSLSRRFLKRISIDSRYGTYSGSDPGRMHELNGPKVNRLDLICIILNPFCHSSSKTDGFGFFVADSCRWKLRTSRIGRRSVRDPGLDRAPVADEWDLQAHLLHLCEHVM